VRTALVFRGNFTYNEAVKRGEDMRFLKGVMSLAIVCLVLVSSASAWSAGFLFTVEILDRPGIARLDDQKLIDTYIDAMIELEAAQTFYNKAGLTPKEYETYKEMLRFRTNLILEFEKRKIEVPRIK